MAVTADDVRALEEAGHQLWVAPEVEEVDGWLLRSAHGLTGRANSVLPTVAGRLSLDAKIDRAERWYAERGLPTRFQLTASSLPDGLDEALDARGYVIPQPPVSVQVAPLADSAPDPRVELAADPADAWLETWAGSRGFSDEATARALLTGSPGETVFAHVDDVAIGRAVACDGRLGITSMVTVPTARRRGLARAIVHTVLAWGHARGCEHALLQVESTNDAARALYATFGFAEHHAYHYRLAP
jgi:GNAT superfamily N-acetyltransferase